MRFQGTEWHAYLLFRVIQVYQLPSWKKKNITLRVPWCSALCMNLTFHVWNTLWFRRRIIRWPPSHTATELMCSKNILQPRAQKWMPACCFPSRAEKKSAHEGKKWFCLMMKSARPRKMGLCSSSLCACSIKFALEQITFCGIAQQTKKKQSHRVLIMSQKFWMTLSPCSNLPGGDHGALQLELQF